MKKIFLISLVLQVPAYAMQKNYEQLECEDDILPAYQDSSEQLFERFLELQQALSQNNRFLLRFEQFEKPGNELLARAFDAGSLRAIEYTFKNNMLAPNCFYCLSCLNLSKKVMTGHHKDNAELQHTFLVLRTARLLKWTDAFLKKAPTFLSCDLVDRRFIKEEIAPSDLEFLKIGFAQELDDLLAATGNDRRLLELKRELYAGGALVIADPKLVQELDAQIATLAPAPSKRLDKFLKAARIKK